MSYADPAIPSQSTDVEAADTEESTHTTRSEPPTQNVNLDCMERDTDKGSGRGISVAEDPYLVSDPALLFPSYHSPLLCFSSLLQPLLSATHFSSGYLGWPR